MFLHYLSSFTWYVKTFKMHGLKVVCTGVRKFYQNFIICSDFRWGFFHSREIENAGLSDRAWPVAAACAAMHRLSSLSLY